MPKGKLESVNIKRVGKGFIVRNQHTWKDDKGIEHWDDSEEIFLDKTKLNKHLEKQVNKM